MKQLLIIEDDKIDQMAFERFAKTPDFQFKYKVANSISEAKKLLKSQSFDAIISDYYLGDGTAFEILEMNNEMPIIVVTGTGTEEIAVNALKKGAFDYLIKDVDGHYLKMLPITVQNALTHFKNIQDIEHYHTNLEQLVEIRTADLKKEIQQRNHVENTLRTSEEKFRTLANIMPAGSYITDKEGNCTYANPRWLKMSGLSLEEALGMGWIKGLHPEDKDRIQKSWYKSQNSRSTWELEYRFQKPDGEVTWVRGIADPMFDDKKKLLGYIGVNLDITEHKRATDALEESEEKNRLLVDNAPLCIYQIGSEKELISMNPTGIEMMGYNHEKEIIGKQYIDTVDELDQKRIDEHLNYALSGQSSSFIYKSKNKLELSASLIPIIKDNGKVIRVMGIKQDITKRIRSEQIQRLLFNISNATITSETLEELIITIRSELGKVLDTTNYYIAFYDAQTDMLSLPFIADELDDAESFPASKSLTGHVIKSKKSLLATKAQQEKMAKEGLIEYMGPRSKIWLGVPLKTEGEIIGVLAIQSYTDESAYSEADMELLEFVSHQISISLERKKADENLKAALKKATESDRLKSAFLATMSHELRTPLNAIIGFSDIINEELCNEDIFKFCKNINSSGNHLLSIVEDLFDITLIETGKTQIQKTEEDLISVLKDIHEIVETELSNENKKNVSLELLLPRGIKTFGLFTDVSKLKQILINLVKNAIKFTDDGHVKYGFKTEKSGEEQILKFFVEDTGIGIPSNMQNIIFDVFRQVDDSYTRAYGGTGIGLSISKKLTQLLGGEIWVESELDKGSTFYFTIPIENGLKDNVKAVSEEQHEFNKQNKTILVVEDDPSSFEFLKTILEKSKIKILKALNGAEAIKICQSNQDIDLVLMDINMPVLDGHKATKKIKKFRPDLPIIAQTAYAIAGDKEKSLEAGCDDYISKPIKRKLLLELIEKHI